MKTKKSCDNCKWSEDYQTAKGTIRQCESEESTNHDIVLAWHFGLCRHWEKREAQSNKPEG